MNFFSDRLQSYVELETYYDQDSNAYVITHTALNTLYHGMNKKPVLKWEFVDMRLFAGTCPAYAVTCRIDDLGIFEVGEMTMEEWGSSNNVIKNNPLSIVINRAFDKAFIRFLSLRNTETDGKKLYSSICLAGRSFSNG